MICATRSGSQIGLDRRRARGAARGGSRAAASAGANSAVTARASSPTSVGSGRSSSEPASSFDRSSRSVASFRRRSTCSRTWSRNWRARLVVELLVLEQLEEAAEREDRRAQLVRGGRDEALARGVELRELALHVVERARELRRARRRASTGKRAEKSPRRDLSAAALEPLDRAATARARRGSRRPSASSSAMRAGDEDPRRTRSTLRRRRPAARRRRRRRATPVVAEQRPRGLADAAVVASARSRWPSAGARAASSATANCEVADLVSAVESEIAVRLQAAAAAATPSSVTRALGPVGGAAHDRFDGRARRRRCRRASTRSRRVAPGVRGESVSSFCVAQARLQRRGDVEVDDAIARA